MGFASFDWDLSWSWSWFWIFPVLGAILLIVLCFCCYQCVQDIYVRFPETLPCQVECYGRGQIHHDIMRKLNITEGQEAPLVLFVYQVSRETEDLRNALKWIEGNQGKNKDDICAVILLEKSLDKQKKPVEVAHQGVFGANTVVVRFFCQQQNSPAKILGGRSNKEAMEKVKESIIRFQQERKLQNNT